MNPRPGNRRSFASQPSVPGLPSRAAPSTTAAEESSRRFGDILRRGHSDGDVLLSGFRSGNSMRNEFTRGEETWMDFLRDSSTREQNIEEQVQIASRNIATMAADRKRRLTGQQEEHSRRRSASSLSFGQTTSERTRLSLPQPTSSHPLFGSARATESRLGQRIIDRPLPPRPSISRSPTRQSRDIALPRWQPDAEVTNCPICGAHFSFWYRKHHCRKCGRVVCANCSPHRITIPRQFIVHSPQEADQDLGLGIASSCTAIDLTDEDEGTLGGFHAFDGAERRQRQEQHIDAALGGGQEVRLCNPCVPDPNPLPHVSFASRGRYNFDSFPSPEDMSRVIQQNQGHPNPASSTVQSQNLPSNTESSVQPRRSHSNSTSNLNQERPLPRTTFIGASAPSRRQSHVPRPSGQFPHLPPNYSSIYGSAPDPSFHERYMSSLHHEHQPSSYSIYRHRHHVSTNSTSSSFRHRSMLDVEVAQPSRVVPQPVLREEDECPICHSALPPKGPDGSEVAREAHVTSCIETHFSSSSPRASRPHPAVATEAAITASVTTPSQARGIAVVNSMQDAEGSQEGSAPFFMPRRRTTGMVVYHASEKDCVGDDGEGAQECVICFEEFAVGDEMGRLECLCKFHKICIRQWWDTKGPGACPVHQGGI